MPIRFIDRAQTIVARIRASLANFTADFDGTFTAAPARTGTITAQLQDHAASFSGVAQANANRTGVISAALGNVTSSIVGTINGGASLTDHQARSEAAGVAWVHEFLTAAEVHQFRRTQNFGNDPLDTGPTPNTVRWILDDGVPCIEIFRPAGTQNPSTWYRPLAPLNAASNGRGVADPAAGGTITVRSFTPTAGGSQIANFVGGNYGNPAYHGDATYDGREYWIQIRAKMDQNRTSGGNEAFDGGKFTYLTRTEQAQTLTDQEIIIVSAEPNGSPVRNIFDMYRSGGTGMDQDPDNDRLVTGNQPGSEFTAGVGDGVCRFDNNGGRLANCYSWPVGWVTILKRVALGLEDQPGTITEVWKQEEGETNYTRIWSQNTIRIEYDAGKPRGHNAFILSAYMNEYDMPADFYHRTRSIIFSREPIAPVGMSSSIIGQKALALAPNGNVAVPEAINPVQEPGDGQLDIQWQSVSAFYDTLRGELQYMGKPASGQSTIYSHYHYTERTNAWVRTNTEASGLSPGTGHIWNAAFDYETGDYYHLFYQRTQLYRYTRATGLWTQVATVPSGTGGAADSGGDNSPGPWPGTAWHPNLFGPKDGGFILNGKRGMWAWRKNGETWHQLSTALLNQDNRGGSCSVYMRDIDAVIMGSGRPDSGVPNGSNCPVYRVNAGSVSTLPAPILMGQSPLPVSGGSGNDRVAKMIAHPSDPTKLIIMEESWPSQPSSALWWVSSDRGATWVQQNSTHGPHPFRALGWTKWTAAWCPTYKVVIGVFSGFNTGLGYQFRIHLWKPPL